MDPSTKSDSINKLKDLINDGKDKEAYDFFKDLYFKHPLVAAHGGDNELGEICNPIGHEILHASKQWQREINWWEAVINTLEEHDELNNVQLHKGLAYHNIVLPLLKLNLPEDAVKYEQKAINEDFQNFNEEEAKKRPAYKLSCFLIPIVKSRKWVNDDTNISDEEKELLILAFESMFSPPAFSPSYSPIQIFEGIEDAELRRTLLERYKAIDRNLGEDPVVVAIYVGSIVEGLLTPLLKNNCQQAIDSFRKIVTNKPWLVCYKHRKKCDKFAEVIDKVAPNRDETTEDKKKRAIDSWSFNMKIEVAEDLGLFGKSNKTALFILCHLLREYRNIVHPTTKDTLGLSKDWSVTFKVEPEIAHMLKAALDIVLNLILQDQGPPTTSPSVLSSEKPVMGSPGIPGDPDEDATQTQTSTSSSSSPVMGSTTTTTLPNDGDKQGEV